MFCPTCGKQCADDAKFCPFCGITMPFATVADPEPVAAPAAQVEPVAAPVVEAAPEPAPEVAPVVEPAPAPAPKPKAPAAPTTGLQKKLAVFLALLAVFALVVGIMHTFCLAKLPVSVSVDTEIPMSGFGMTPQMNYEDYYFGSSPDSYSPSAVQVINLDGEVVVVDANIGLISEALDLVETSTAGMVDTTIVPGYIGMILFGIANLAIAAFGVLYYINIRTGKCGIFGFLKGKSILGFVGLVGASTALIHILLMLTTGVSQNVMGLELAINIGTHWTAWVALMIYGVMIGYPLLRLDKTRQ